MLYAAFVDSHRDQLQSIPKNLWKPIHRKLCWDNEPTELELLVSDPDCHKVTLRLPVSLLTDTQSATTDIGDLDPDGQVFVLDHMFTFPEDKLYESLEATDRPEVDLVANILKRRGMDTSTTDALANAIWVVADAYAMTVTDGSGKSAQHHMWYIPGEKILNMQHSDTPNMECRIFFDMYGMRPVSMLWPTRVIKPGETLTRDYLWSSKDKKERQALAFAWFQKNEPLLQQIAPNLIRDSAQSILDQPSVDQLKARSSLATPTDCNMQTRVNGLSIGEDSSDAEPGSSSSTWQRCLLPFKDKYLVYSPDISKHLFKSSLDGSRFGLTDDISKADIVWTAAKIERHTLLPHQFFNQFPNQGALVVKDMLQACIYKKWGFEGARGWYPLSFNLNSDVHAFIAEFLGGQEQDSHNNVWIVKPWNGTRSQGITISRSLPQILKQLATGPKLVAKYIHPPALLEGKIKFDLRVLVIVESVSPLRMYFVPSAIYARESHIAYDANLKNLHSFAEHFTVMGYRNLHVVRSPLADLVKRIEACAPPSQAISFDKDILPRILAVIRKGVEAAIFGSESCALDADEQVKTIFGADVLLDSELNPWLLEFSVVPDTGRVIDMWPTLYGDLFESLFVTRDVSDKFTAF
ncbi:hypothetical protein BASA61_008343 [Batrachochytrium salamandrivorans]|nr:hypothetical protein BASA62_009169 [Batrachochytrium salamandrivorans]KAH6577180.1 hypothetical protein BASA60_004114 [Batrachochytrium salamandrivorans]KAH6582931.1 hypothetical protein BASA61_008343 [Batrachochytrium salamandrivorans]KAH9245366.1 hypothetical protein BASA81_017173 [Batrachochytrium salamandrivorans]